MLRMDGTQHEHDLINRNHYLNHSYQKLIQMTAMSSHKK